MAETILAKGLVLHLSTNKEVLIRMADMPIDSVLGSLVDYITRIGNNATHHHTADPGCAINLGVVFKCVAIPTLV